MRTLTATLAALLLINCAPEALDDELAIAEVRLEDEPAGAARELTDAEVLALEVTNYAGAVGVSETEARRRVHAMRAYQAALEDVRALSPAAFDRSFSRSRITHAPFAMRTSFKGPVPSNGSARLASAGAIVDTQATATRVELDAEIDRLSSKLATAFPTGEFRLGTGDDGAVVISFANRGAQTDAALQRFVTTNRGAIALRATSLAGDELFRPADVDGVDADDSFDGKDDSQSIVAAPACTLRGGERLNISTVAECTAGFGGTYCYPRGPNGCVPALLTAGHCANRLTYSNCSSGITLTTPEAHQGGFGDVQISKTSKSSNPRGTAVFKVSDQGHTIAVRSVATVISEGAVISKYGRVTGLMTIEITDSSTTFRGDGAPQLSRVVEFKRLSDGPAGEGGDSGGPVFQGAKAFGTHIGSNRTHTRGYFSAVRFLSSALPNARINVRR